MQHVTIAKSFLNSTKSLSTAERSGILDFLMKFHSDPSSPGLNLEGVKSAIDPNIKSARITQAVRAIIHQSGDHFTLLYAGQHDEAYDWASRRTLKKNPATGVLQIVETAEELQDSFASNWEVEPSPPLFAQWEDSYLLSLGLPEEWLPTIRLIKNEDQILTAVEKLPEEVGERLLSLASGEFVTPPEPVSANSALESSPDNLRRFWVVKDAAELVELLQKPIEEWMRFLHPSQQNLVTGVFKGPVKVTGSAGTGKTVVAMHRARHLAREGQRVLLTSFVTTLCHNLQRNLQILCNDEERSWITVGTVHSQALQMARKDDPNVYPVDERKIRESIEEYLQKEACSLTPDFVYSEWNNVIQRMGIATWQEYRYAQRKGRGKSLSTNDRLEIWDVVDQVLQELRSSGGMPWSHICRKARELLKSKKVDSPYDAVVVDEIQDLSAEDLRFLSALCPRPGNLMLVGDAGQRIYGTSFSLSRLGIEVRGRSHLLKINYRTTEQIRRFADSILGDKSDNMDGGAEDRTGTRSLFGGPEPTLKGFDSIQEGHRFVLDRIKELLQAGLTPRGIAIFARTGKLLNPIRELLTDSEIPLYNLSAQHDAEGEDGVNLGTMHRAKGLEFKVVFAVDCSHGTLPLEHVAKKIQDPLELQEFMDRERQLLYVTITRARDEAYVLWTGVPSQFVGQLLGKQVRGDHPSKSQAEGR